LQKSGHVGPKLWSRQDPRANFASPFFAATQSLLVEQTSSDLQQRLNVSLAKQGKALFSFEPSGKKHFCADV
jgi:hypothetical protein